MNIQLVIVIVIVACAVVYVARSIYKSAKGNSCETGSCNCEPKVTKKGAASH